MGADTWLAVTSESLRSTCGEGEEGGEEEDPSSSSPAPSSFLTAAKSGTN